MVAKLSCSDAANEDQYRETVFFILFSLRKHMNKSWFLLFVLFHCCSQLKQLHLKQTHINIHLFESSAVCLSLFKNVPSCLVRKISLMDDGMKDSESTHSSRWPKMYPWTKSDSQRRFLEQLPRSALLFLWFCATLVWFSFPFLLHVEFLMLASNGALVTTAY